MIDQSLYESTLLSIIPFLPSTFPDISHISLIEYAASPPPLPSPPLFHALQLALLRPPFRITVSSRGEGRRRPDMILSPNCHVLTALSLTTVCPLTPRGAARLTRQTHTYRQTDRQRLYRGTSSPGEGNHKCGADGVFLRKLNR